MMPHNTCQVSYYCLYFTDNGIEVHKDQSDYASK